MTSYINTRAQTVYDEWFQPHVSPAVDWDAIAWDRLAWRYTPECADAIQAGRDPATQADIARWNRLGRRSAA